MSGACFPVTMPSKLVVKHHETALSFRLHTARVRAALLSLSTWFGFSVTTAVTPSRR